MWKKNYNQQNHQCSDKICQPIFKNDVKFSLYKKHVDNIALRISYDMEYCQKIQMTH
jgi:hypothetical protein